MRTKHHDHDTTDGTVTDLHEPEAIVETNRDRRALAAHAGVGRISLLSVTAGTLVAFGSFGIVGAVAATVATAAGFEGEIASADWREIGIVGAVLSGIVLFVSWFFGGYVAGRMARRAGSVHGLLSLVLGLVVTSAIGTVLATTAGTDADAITRNVRSLGLPVGGSEWAQAATIAGIIAVVAIVAGAIGGGSVGERWHTRLLQRALDPDVGTEARAYDRVATTRTRLATARDDVATQKADAVERVHRARGAGSTPTEGDLDGDGRTDHDVVAADGTRSHTDGDYPDPAPVIDLTNGPAEETSTPRRFTRH